MARERYEEKTQKKFFNDYFLGNSSQLQVQDMQGEEDNKRQKNN